MLRNFLGYGYLISSIVVGVAAVGRMRVRKPLFIVWLLWSAVMFEELHRVSRPAPERASPSAAATTPQGAESPSATNFHQVKPEKPQSLSGEQQGPSCRGILEGRITVAGLSIGKVTDGEPVFWFRNEKTGETQEGVSSSYDPATSTYRFAGLPDGPVGVSAKLHITGTRPTLPGNYDLWHVVNLEKIPPGQRNDYELRFEKIMRLTAPADTSAILHYLDSDRPSYSSPVVFQWEPVKGAAIYQVTLRECREPGHPTYSAGCSRCTELAIVQPKDTAAAFELKPSEKHSHYEFSLLAADSRNRPLGKLMTTYDDGGYGWDYRFRISGTTKRVGPTSDP